MPPQEEERGEPNLVGLIMRAEGIGRVALEKQREVSSEGKDTNSIREDYVFVLFR